MKIIQDFQHDLEKIDLTKEETFQLPCMQRHSITSDLKRNISSQLQILEHQTQQSITSQIKKRVSAVHDNHENIAQK